MNNSKQTLKLSNSNFVGFADPTEVDTIMASLKRCTAQAFEAGMQAAYEQLQQYIIAIRNAQARLKLDGSHLTPAEKHDAIMLENLVFAISSFTSRR